jgi:hypothetical protein
MGEAVRFYGEEVLITANLTPNNHGGAVLILVDETLRTKHCKTVCFDAGTTNLKVTGVKFECS